MIPQVCLRVALCSLHRHCHVVSSIGRRCCNRMVPVSVPSVLNSARCLRWNRLLIIEERYQWLVVGLKFEVPTKHVGKHMY